MALTGEVRLHQYLDDWLTSASSQKEAQVNTDRGKSNPVLSVENQSRVQVQAQTHSGVFVRGLRIPPRFGRKNESRFLGLKVCRCSTA